MCLFHCLASTLPHSFRVSVSLFSETLATNLSHSAKNSALSVSCAPSTDLSGYAPASYGDKHGAWVETNGTEMYNLLALLMYMGLCKLPKETDYWRTSTLYNGNWARRIIGSRDRYLALMKFLHITDPAAENPGDRLRKSPLPVQSREANL